ncbi:MAG TPA: GGDEF domain-containing response regulator [Opitutaceae bacterium]|nr:GGDEF domain-containing response regulator [Opitutaceae bacterium]
MPRKVLLIDDDRLQYRVTQAHFENFRSEEYELHWASTYEEGLKNLLSGAYDVCLLDYQLGPRDGLQLIKEAVAQGCRVPIVFLTAEASERVDIDAMNAGALDYLVKGEITPRAIERSLRYALKLGDTMEALRLLATRDQLTGQLNRREFDRILQEEQERALRFGHPLALVLVDIDHFKAVNDTHGHQAGDTVLREIAERLAKHVRSVDRVARFGGEEFALILVQADYEAAARVAQTICQAQERTPVKVGAITLTVTVSAGIAILPEDASTGAELISAADRALYGAKDRGRNRVMRFDQLGY